MVPAMSEQQRPIVYAGYERPDVEVLVDDQWLPGEVRMVTWDDDGRARHEIQYRPAGSTSSVIDSFTDDQVRADTVDRSRGRTARS
jgi:hypothetical protein